MSYSTEIRLTLIVSVERFSDPIKLSTIARRKGSLCLLAYIYILCTIISDTYVWLSVTHFISSAILQNG